MRRGPIQAEVWLRTAFECYEAFVDTFSESYAFRLPFVGIPQASGSMALNLLLCALFPA
jgi:hypothetical protein